MKKQPRAQKSKAEILETLKLNIQFQKNMAFIKEKFWPLLIEASTSVDDATILLSGFNTTLMQEFLGLMKTKTMKELGLASKLDASSDKFLENQKLLALFDDMSVFEAKDLIEGMRSEIGLFQQEEWKERPLSSLKPRWMEDYIKDVLK